MHFPNAHPAHGGGGKREVTLTWSDEHSGDPDVTGYRLYYDQAGKALLITELGLITAYTDTGLTRNQEYCYRVSTLSAACRSDLSNVLCATP